MRLLDQQTNRARRFMYLTVIDVKCWLCCQLFRNAENHPPVEPASSFAASENLSGDTEIDKERGS